VLRGGKRMTITVTPTERLGPASRA
jgi:hypothetical protein